MGWFYELFLSIGLMDALKEGNYHLIDRSVAKNFDEQREIFSKAVLSDYFLMSSNAITLDGELINIDGTGNRVACLSYGPKTCDYDRWYEQSCQ